MAVFSNQATLSYRNVVASSNTVTGEIVEVLSAEKNAVSGSYNPDEDITYVVTIRNTGTTAYTNLTLTDNLGEYSVAGGTASAVPLTYKDNTVNYYVNGERQGTLTVESENPLRVTGITVPAGGNATIIYTARANNFAPVENGGTITNTAEVSGVNPVVSATAEETVSVEPAPVLTIGKQLSPSTVPENGQITYTFNIENTGNTEADAAGNAVFRDTFNPIIDITSVTYNGTPWTEGVNYSYNAVTGEFVSEDNQITVPAADIIVDDNTGERTVIPGRSTLVITGNINGTA